MQTELLEELKLNRKVYEQKVLTSIKDDIYQNERYDVNFTLALGATCSEVDMEEFSGLIRESDRFIILDKHICCVVFPFTDSAQGVKATSNLLSKFEMKFFSQKIYLSIVNARDCETPEHHVQKLFDVLKFSIQHGMHNMPLDNVSF
jgi:hypothetical protein